MTRAIRVHTLLKECSTPEGRWSITGAAGGRATACANFYHSFYLFIIVVYIFYFLTPNASGPLHLFPFFLISHSTRLLGL